MADESPLIGTQAPAFTLEDHTGAERQLSDYRGWRVVYFYPRADTPGCTTEACEFTDAIADFVELNAAVIGISPDPPERLARFIDKHDLKVTLLSDPDYKVMARYGAWGEKKLYGKTALGVKRSTVIIDPAGKIAHHWRSVKAKGHALKVKEKLQSLRGDD